MEDVTRSPLCKGTSYLRKIKKPIIEKKRRDRINSCLNQLKDILLKTMNQTGNAQIAKLDKADILEMTVSHLQQVQYQHMAIAMATNTKALSQYREGYSECATETVKYLHSTEGSRKGLSTRIEKHITGTVRPSASSHLTIKTEPMSISVPTACKSALTSSYPSNNTSLLMAVPASGLTRSSPGVEQVRCTGTGQYVPNGHNGGILAIPTCQSGRISPSQTPEKVWRPW